MAACEAQVLESKDFTATTEYQFSGNEVTVQRKCVCLQGIIDNHTITHGAYEAGVSRKTVHQWINTDPIFAEAVHDAMQQSTERLETSMYKRAMEKDTIAGIFLLKKYNPEFRDRVTVDVEVIRDEILERMEALNLKDLPQLPAAMMSEFIPVEQTTESLQFRDQREQIQKGDSTESESSSE